MLLANVFKLRCTVVTQECAVSRFRVITFSRSCVPFYPHVPELKFWIIVLINSSVMRSDIMLPRSMKGELRFFGVSSLSHGFARALPYSALERRNWDFFSWFSSNLSWKLSRDFFSWFSSNSIWDIFNWFSAQWRNLKGGVLSPNIPGLASYLTSFSVPTGCDGSLPNSHWSTPSCATSRFCLEVTLRAG